METREHSRQVKDNVVEKSEYKATANLLRHCFPPKVGCLGKCLKSNKEKEETRSCKEPQLWSDNYVLFLVIHLNWQAEKGQHPPKRCKEAHCNCGDVAEIYSWAERSCWQVDYQLYSPFPMYQKSWRGQGTCRKSCIGQFKPMLNFLFCKNSLSHITLNTSPWLNPYATRKRLFCRHRKTVRVQEQIEINRKKNPGGKSAKGWSNLTLGGVSPPSRRKRLNSMFIWKLGQVEPNCN